MIEEFMERGSMQSESKEDAHNSSAEEEEGLVCPDQIELRIQESIPV
jgi:hypothetical protein